MIFRLPKFRADLRCKCGRWVAMFDETQEGLQKKLAECDWTSLVRERSPGETGAPELKCGACQ